MSSSSSRRAQAGFARRRSNRSEVMGYAMVAPLLVFILALALYPTVLTTIDAFMHIDALSPPNHFAGFGNFTAIFSNPQIRQSFENTGWYVLFGVGLTLVLGTAFGLLLQRRFRGRGVVLAIVILPWALPGVVEGVIWSWIYDPTFGVLNSALKSLHLLSQYQLFIGTRQIESILLTSLVQVWQITPLATLLVLASLQSIPGEVYEAARVDGAGWWQVIRRITLPLIRPGLADRGCRGARPVAEHLRSGLCVECGRNDRVVGDERYLFHDVPGSQFSTGIRALALGDRGDSGALPRCFAASLPEGHVLDETAARCLGAEDRDRARDRVVPVSRLLGAQHESHDELRGTEHPYSLLSYPANLRELSGDLRGRSAGPRSCRWDPRVPW